MSATINGLVQTGVENNASLGLSATQNSLAYRVAVIERNLVSGARWFEDAAVAVAGTHEADLIGSGAGAFQIDAGNDDWGAWVQVLGSSDTPVQAGRAYFGPHQIIVEDCEVSKTYFVQMARGSTGAAGLAAGTYSEFVYSAENTKGGDIIQVQTGRAPAGSKLFMRCKCSGQNTATLDFYLGIREYEG
jgi:hypothetical protein